MLRTFVCLAFALGLVFAVEEEHIASAHETIKLMMSQGADANACKDLAESSIKDVNNAFNSNQAQLNALNTGSECVKNADRDAGVPAAQTAVDNALAAQTKAKANLEAARNVVPQVETPSVYALSLNSGKACDWVYSTSYQTANAAMTGAQDTLTKAKATVTATQSALSNAQTASARQAHTCQCNAVAASDKAWATISAAGLKNDQATSWTKSQNILCALSGTSPCTFPSVPEPTRPAFSPDTAAVADTCRAEAIAAEQAQKEVSQKEVLQKQESSSKEQSSKERCSKFTVTVCNDDNYGGGCWTRGPGNYDINNLGICNDCISAVQVGDGGVFSAWPDSSYNGFPITVGAGNYPSMRAQARYNGANWGSNWNDQISSYRIECT